VLRRGIIGIAAIIGLLLLIGGGLFLYSPALLVDVVDRVANRSGAEKKAEAIKFGPHAENLLDIWGAAEGKGGAQKPVLVFFYGGGWANGTRTEYGYAARPFVEAGYIVVLPDYRKVPQVHFPDFVADSAAAVKWVQTNIAQYGGDPDRIAVAGHSAGAYNALMLALDPQWLGEKPVRAAISLAGAADFYPFTSKRAIAAMSQAPDPAATQPINFARAGVPPLLLIHGTADDVVRPRNAKNLQAKMDVVKGDSSISLYEGASHNDLVLALSTLFRGRHPVVKDMLAFMEKALAPRPAQPNPA
jgi:acetyl esterase/lipase